MARQVSMKAQNAIESNQGSDGLTGVLGTTAHRLPVLAARREHGSQVVHTFVHIFKKSERITCHGVDGTDHSLKVETRVRTTSAKGA
jgi:hypothetical protein